MKYLTVLLLTGAVLLGSCQKDNNTGGAIIFYGETTSDSLQSNGITGLTIYVSNEIAGTYATNVYWSGSVAPDCGEPGAVTVEKETNSGIVLAYRVEDQTGVIIWAGQLLFNPGECDKVELVW